MANMFAFAAENRDLSGKSVARAARRNGKVPAIVYGGKSAPQSIVLTHTDVIKSLEHEAVYSHILDLTIDGKPEKAILKAVQRHPAKPRVLHLDFMRVDESQALKVNVPLHFINEDTCVGVKAGGVVTHSMVDIEVSCLPADLPEYIEVDLAAVDIGGSIHLADIVLPSGVSAVILAQEGDHNLTVAQVMKTKVVAEDDDTAASVDEDSSDEESSDE